MSARERESDDDDDDKIEQQQQPPLQKVVQVAKTYTTNVEPENPLPLDWTKLSVSASDGAFPIRYPDDVATWSSDDTEIRIVGTSGQKITVIGENTFSDRRKTNTDELKSLVLRSHLIKDMAGLGSLPKLETLELYDNMVQSFDEASMKGCGRTALRVLDMSYNAIRDMTPVQYCNGETLTELYLANNKLKQISGLKHLTNLRKLDLGANKIRAFNGEEFQGLHNLTDLLIGKNKIESLDGIQSLTKLQRLDVQSNRITSVVNEKDGLCYLNSQRGTLEELLLAHNGLDDNGISGFISLTGRGGDEHNIDDDSCSFPKLTILDISRNRLTSMDPLFLDSKNDKILGKWPMLEDIWLSGNDIKDFDAVHPLKEASDRNHIPKLETVYLEYNPVANDFQYRQKLAEFVPTLKQIDATMIRGYGSVPVPPASATGANVATEERLRQLQETAIQRAKQQKQ